MFPVLFVGLAALTARGRDDVLRACAAGALVAAMSFVPPVYPFAAIIAALVVSVPMGRR